MKVGGEWGKKERAIQLRQRVRHPALLFDLCLTTASRLVFHRSFIFVFFCEEKEKEIRSAAA